MGIELEAGALIGRYRLTRALAEGGMGTVWAAVDTRLDREVALKLLPRLLVGDPSVERRFEREARALARLRHPNVVAVFDVGAVETVAGGTTPFLVMELVEGRSLRAILADGPLPSERATHLLAQVAAGLAAAHEAGVVHRDLKPSNIMVGDGDVVTVLDFGLARFMPAASGSMDESLTTPGMVLGSCAYMAPEQARGEAVTPASDVFAVGAVGWEMLVGWRVFDGASPLDVLQAVVRCEPDPLVEVAPTTPCSLARVVERCLQRDPAARYATCGELAAALRALPPADEASAEVAPSARRRRSWLPLLTLFGLGAAALLGFEVADRRAPDGRPTAPVVRELAAPGGRVSDPAGHPLGGVVAVRDRDGVSEIIAVGGGEITPLLTAPAGIRWRSPQPSADGRLLAVTAVRPAAGDSEVRVLPMAGGPPLAVVPDAASAVWLGRTRLAYLEASSGRIAVLELGGSPPRPVNLGATKGRVEELAGNAGAGLLALVLAERGLLVRWSDDLEHPEPWWQADAAVHDVAWLGADRSAVVSVGDELLAVPARGQPRTVVSWPRLGDVAVVDRPSRVVAVMRESWSELVAIAADGTGGEEVMVRLPLDSAAAVSAEGAIAFERSVGASAHWWLRAPAGGEAPLDCGAGRVLRVVPNRAGDELACLVAVASGDVELRRAVVARGEVSILAPSVSWRAAPAWSADGRSIAAVEREPAAVVVVDAVDGATRVVAETTAIGLAFSPDGEWLMYRVPLFGSSEPAGVWAASLQPGVLPRRVTHRPESVAWRPGPPGLWQLRSIRGRLELWEAELAGPWRRHSVLAVAGVAVDQPVFGVDASSGRVLLWRTLGSDRLVAIGSSAATGDDPSDTIS